MEDPNIIYGGDLKGSEAIDFASLGEMIIEYLKRNGDKRNFVSYKSFRSRTVPV
jgi:hypothetical protein